MIPKVERERLEIFERMIRIMQEQKNQQIGHVETDYYRNSVEMQGNMKRTAATGTEKGSMEIQ